MKIKVDYQVFSGRTGDEIIDGLESDYPAFYVEREFSRCTPTIVEFEAEEFRNWMKENIQGEYFSEFSLPKMITAMSWWGDGYGYETLVVNRFTILEGNSEEVRQFILDCLKECESLQSLMDRERFDAEDERETLNSYLYDM